MNNQPNLKKIEAMCVKCYARFSLFYEETQPLRELTCPYCEEKGYLINTGESEANLPKTKRLTWYRRRITL